MSGKNRNKLFLSVLICGILIVIVVISFLFYIKNLVVQNQYISDSVGKKLPTKFAYTDGPEFDGHKVDFDLVLKRLSTYKEEKKIKMEEMESLLKKD